MLQVVGQIDRRHPALTELALDAVSARQGCVQAGDGIGVVHLPKMPIRAANREIAPLHGGWRPSLPTQWFRVCVAPAPQPRPRLSKSLGGV